jgi:dTDP-4-dehydrorhamnose 3,5-epimerase
VSRFKIVDTPLLGLKIIERIRASDARGFLSRLFCAEELAAAGWHKPIAQINHTLTRHRGAVRGMHFQHPPHAETKLVTCLRGEVWDVAVDLRLSSPTLLHWFAERLSPENGRAMLIPEGFAHGFQALTPDCELLYLHSCAYTPASEGAIHPEDPRVGIAWPQVITERSVRDQSHPMLTAEFVGIPV